MKLGIFGDSYGKCGGYDHNENDWVDFLNLTNKYEITNFSKGGSSLWYSYDLFIKNNKDFDKIIFLITSPHRIFINNPNCIIHPFQSYNASILINEAEGKEKEQYQTVINYYELLHDYDKEEYIHRLLVENIKTLRPDTIIYPCFNFSYIDDVGLFEITNFEDKCLGLNSEIKNNFYRQGKRDSRKCHMTEANNKIVADMFLERLNGNNLKINLDTLVKPEVDLNYYYKTTWTVKDINSFKIK